MFGSLPSTPRDSGPAPRAFASPWFANLRRSMRLAFGAMLLAAFIPAPLFAEISVRVTAGPVDQNINVFVSVTGEAGDPILDLRPQDFIIQVGKNNPLSGTDPIISSFTQPPAEGEQLSAVFAMDFTTTVRTDPGGALDAIKRGTDKFVQQMQPGDYAGVIKFNIDLGADMVCPLQELQQPQVGGSGESTVSPLYDCINDDYRGAGTNLNAAIKLALDYLDPKSELHPLSGLPAGPRTIIVLGDGEDNYPEFMADEDGNLAEPEEGETGAEVVAFANDLGVRIFTIGVGKVAEVKDWENRMKNLAQRTGGEYFEAVDDVDIAVNHAYETISGLVRNEYLLTFPSGIDNCEEQELTVQVNSDIGKATFQHTGCSPSGGSSGGGAFGPLGLIAGLSLLALRRRLTMA